MSTQTTKNVIALFSFITALTLAPIVAAFAYGKNETTSLRSPVIVEQQMDAANLDKYGKFQACRTGAVHNLTIEKMTIYWTCGDSGTIQHALTP